MDFSRYLDSGDLSDVTVVVDDKDFELHKFPLYIHSNFFKEKAQKNEGEISRIELEDFPGGPDVFQKVADFCYNKPTPISPDNACVMRCAAQFLGMTLGGSNLASVCDRMIDSVLATARSSRDVQSVADLLLTCRLNQSLAEEAKIVERCSDTLVDCWLVSSYLVPRRPIYPVRISNPTKPLSDSENKRLLKTLIEVPFDWFLKIFVTARDKNVQPEILSALVQGYITTVMKTEAPENGSCSEKENSESVDTADEKVDDEQEKEPKEEENENDDSNKQNEVKESTEEISNKETESISKILDILLKEIPSELSLADTLSPVWVLRMLQNTTRVAPQSRTLLVKLAAKVVHKFTSEELALLSLDTMKEIIISLDSSSSEDKSYEESSDTDEEEQQVNEETQGQICEVVDRYLLQMTSKDELNVEAVCELAKLIRSNLKNDSARNDDVLYEAIEKMIKSEKIQVTDENKQQLLDLVDCSYLSETSLQTAYSSELMPPTHVTKAALELCTRLRKDLDEANQVIRCQEAELDKYGLGARSRTNTLPISTSYISSHNPSSYLDWCGTSTTPYAMTSEPYYSSYKPYTPTMTSLPLNTSPVSRKYGANRNRRNYRFS